MTPSDDEQRTIAGLGDKAISTVQEVLRDATDNPGPEPESSEPAAERDRLADRVAAEQRDP